MCANWKTLSRERWYSPLRNALTWTFCRKVSAARKLFVVSGCSFPSFCPHCPLSQARVTPRTIRIRLCFKSWTKSSAASSSTCSSAPAGTRPKPRSDFSSPFQHSTRKSSVSESMFVAAAAATRRLPPPWESNRWLVSEIFSVVSPSRNSPPNRVHYGHISMAKSLPPAHLSGISASQHEWPVLLECASPKCDAVKLNELLRSADWTRLLLLAEEHGVVGHLAAHLHELDRDLVPPEMNKTLMECQREQIFLTLRLTAELFRLLKRFDAAEIGDLAVLVRQRDIRRATELMIAAGYQAAVPVSAIDSGKIPGQYLFSAPDSKLLVELHNDYTLRYFPRRLLLERFFERQVRVLLDSRKAPALSVEDELVLICVHGAKHYWERLMWIADVAALVCSQTNLDWKRAAESAREVGAERMLHAGLLLAANLLRAPLPGKVLPMVHSDSGAAKLAGQVLEWLPAAGSSPPGLLARALFRMRMCGGLISAPAYLLRLSFSPTEEDWKESAEEKRHWFPDAVRRPFRLARKYGRDSSGLILVL